VVVNIFDQGGLGKVLKHVPLSKEPGAEIFNGWRMGEISTSDWFVMSAARMADDSVRKSPKRYPEMPSGLRDYCQGRIERDMPYDQTMAKRLGIWFHALQGAHFENETIVQDMAWAMAKLREAKLNAHIKKCEDAITRVNQVPFPCDDARLAIETKKRDAHDRISSGGKS